jgi:hypothetical protein
MTRSAGVFARVRESVALAVLATSGCEITDVEIERSGTATIPEAPTNGPFAMARIDDLELELGEIEDEHDIGTEDISSAEVMRFTVEAIDPGTADLSFIDRIEVFAQSDDLEEVRVAHLDENPGEVAFVALAIDDVELREYVAADLVTLVARFDGESPRTDVVLRATVVMDIGVTVRGACNHM